MDKKNACIKFHTLCHSGRSFTKSAQKVTIMLYMYIIYVILDSVNFENY